MLTVLLNGWVGRLEAWLPSLSTIADIVSLISLALTVFVIYEIRRIKNFYLLRARMPDLVGRLRKHSSNLSNYLNDFDNSLPQVVKELALSEAVMTNLAKKLRGDSRKSIQLLLESTNAFRTRNTNINLLGREKEGLRAVYVNMAKAVQELEDLQEDTSWER